MFVQDERKIKRIAIIGAGPAGVTAAKYCLAENAFDVIDIYEQQAGFGGVWNHSSEKQGAAICVPQEDPFQSSQTPQWTHQTLSFLNPMYDNLETNIPHVLMKHSDDSSLQDTQLFPGREFVLRYLIQYASDVASHVRFNCQVQTIRVRSEDHRDIWTVESQNLLSGSPHSVEYDAICVASGHYDVSYMPNIQGIRAWNHAYPGTISHSKFYQKPDTYKGRKTLVIGNSASGADICSQIATVARLPVLVSQRSESPLSYPQSYKDLCPEIAEFIDPDIADRAVRFSDGRVESDIDAILFCTGYLYAFPFLASMQNRLIDDGFRVKRLYKQVFLMDHPSLAFVGLPSKIIPFRTFEGQAAVIARVWADRLALPELKEMELAEAAEAKERGQGRTFHVLPYPKDFHYHNDMIDWAAQVDNPKRGKSSQRWSEEEFWTRKNFPLIKRAFTEKGEARHGICDLSQLGFGHNDWIQNSSA